MKNIKLIASHVALPVAVAIFCLLANQAMGSGTFDGNWNGTTNHDCGN